MHVLPPKQWFNSWQASQSVDKARVSDHLPRSQLTHVACPGSLLCVPATQSKHLSIPVWSLVCLPGRQSMHTASDVLAVFPVAFPLGQLMHATEAAAGWYFPMEHSMQALILSLPSRSLNRPCGQFEHSTTVASFLNIPAPHSKQPDCNGSVEYWPTTHALQSLTSSRSWFCVDSIPTLPTSQTTVAKREGKKSQNKKNCQKK